MRESSAHRWGTRSHMHNRAEMLDKAADVAKAAPPLASASATFAGYELGTIIEFLTVVWLSLLISGWLWDRFVSKFIAKLQAKRKTKRKAKRHAASVE